jgi:hypothetical protein
MQREYMGVYPGSGKEGPTSSGGRVLYFLAPKCLRRLQLDEMTPGVSLEGSQMSHETLPLDNVVRRARWMVGSFRQEDVDRVLMRPN